MTSSPSIAGTGQLGVAHAGIQPRADDLGQHRARSDGDGRRRRLQRERRAAGGALVAGGLALVADRRQRILPHGGRARRRRDVSKPAIRSRAGAASAEIVVLPGPDRQCGRSRLEARATITGRVLDANGTPVPRATVRIPSLGGFTFVFANDSGVFRFPDLPLGDYLIQAPGPSQGVADLVHGGQRLRPEQRIHRRRRTGRHWRVERRRRSATSNAVLAAYQDAVRTFLNVDESLLVGLPMANFGGFGWNRTRLFQDSTTAVADIRFLRAGHRLGPNRRRRRPSDWRADTHHRARRVENRRSRLSPSWSASRPDAATGAFSFGRYPAIRSRDLPDRRRTRRRLHYRCGASVQPVDRDVPRSAQHDDAEPCGHRRAVPRRHRDQRHDPRTRAHARRHARRRRQDTQVAISFGDLTVTTGADGRFDSALADSRRHLHVHGPGAVGTSRPVARAGPCRRQRRRRRCRLLGLGVGDDRRAASERPTGRGRRRRPRARDVPRAIA